MQWTEQDRQKLGDLRRYEGSSLYDAEGSKIGRIERVLVDSESSEPRWLEISTPQDGMRILPFGQMEPMNDGYRSVYTSAQVQGSPPVTRGREFSAEEQRPLLFHYGLREEEGRARSSCISREEAEERRGEVLGPAVGNLVSSKPLEPQAVCEDESDEPGRRVA